MKKTGSSSSASPRRCQAETNLFRDVFYQQNLSVLGNKALLFAAETNLVQMQEVLRASQPFIRQFTQTTNLVSLFEQVNTAFRTAPREETAETRSLVKIIAGVGADRFPGARITAAFRRAAVAERHDAAGRR